MPIFTLAIDALVGIGFSTFFATNIVSPTIGVSFSEFDANDIRTEYDHERA
jgi:hypothetical protein